MKIKKIEVLIGSTDENVVLFRDQINELFRICSDYKTSEYKPVGGNMRQIVGRYDEITDNVAFELNFYVEPEFFYSLLHVIESKIKQIRPVGVSKISVKGSEVDSYNVVL